jgi:hypothetical protein
MIVVKIELHSANTLRTTQIGGDHEHGDYDVRVMNKGKLDGDPRLESDICRSGEVTKYPRLSYNVWRLISRALRSAFPEEK